MASVATFACFAELPFEIREQIWQYALPDHQNVIVIGGTHPQNLSFPLTQGDPLATHHSYTSGLPWDEKEFDDGTVVSDQISPPLYSWDPKRPHRGPFVSYKPPALLHTCRQSRTVGLRTYPPCFKEQIGIPVLFNLSKDLLLFSDDDTFRRFLKLSFNTYGKNVFGLPVDLRFLGICGPIRCEPAHYETTHSRLYLFDRLEELILENRTALPNHEVNPPFLEDLKEVWIARRTKAAKRLKGYASKEDLVLPRVSFLSLEEIKQMASGSPAQEQTAEYWKYKVLQLRRLQERARRQGCTLATG
ncbi:hypothetical protein N431DRAFT_119359 [Stipitochalara longipes BDJ]|nr:hypothetical protein N431DRAFT_119359 [Stipitochalara longipes BDJ]